MDDLIKYLAERTIEGSTTASTPSGDVLAAAILPQIPVDLIDSNAIERVREIARGYYSRPNPKSVYYF